MNPENNLAKCLYKKLINERLCGMEDKQEQCPENGIL